MKRQFIPLLLAATLLSGCTSVFGGLGSFGIGSREKEVDSYDREGRATARRPASLAYVGNLANNRVARVGDTIAYAKNKDGSSTTIYVYRGVDGKGGIHINRTLQRLNANGLSAKQMAEGKGPNGTAELVFLPEQTLLISAGVHIVFVRSTPTELHYRVVMVGG